jgi:hypothetical protein
MCSKLQFVRSRFSRRWLWRMSSSGMWRRLDLVWTDVSEERIASIFRVESHKQGTSDTRTVFQQLIKFHHKILGMVTIIRGRQPRNQGLIPGTGKRFSVLHWVQIGSGFHPFCCSVAIWDLSMRAKWLERENVKLTTHVHLALRWRMFPVPRTSSWCSA